MEKTTKLQRTFEKFEKAFKKYSEAVKPNGLFPSLDEELLIEIVTKRFEYTFESMWKVAKEYLRVNGVICNAPIPCFREAFKEGLIAPKHEGLFVKMVDNRNTIVHVYDLDQAKEIYQFIASKEVFSAIESLHQELKKRLP